MEKRELKIYAKHIEQYLSHSLNPYATATQRGMSQ
uniref:Chromosome 1 open reading frame 105 n=1 Tax=Propithecus coquereli TaxID=379532 RepID=A0A2K6GH45_PROCO